MMAEHDSGQESGRVVAGVLGLFLVGALAKGRLSPVFCTFAGIVFMSGYLVNAVLLLKLMAAY